MGAFVDVGLNIFGCTLPRYTVLNEDKSKNTQGHVAIFNIVYNKMPEHLLFPLNSVLRANVFGHSNIMVHSFGANFFTGTILVTSPFPFPLPP